jgi:uncharacterized membrane protein
VLAAVAALTIKAVVQAVQVVVVLAPPVQLTAQTALQIKVPAAADRATMAVVQATAATEVRV